jgi:hypothetical protein
MDATKTQPFDEQGIRERLAKATPGPYYIHDKDFHVASFGTGLDGKDYRVASGFAIRDGLLADAKDDAEFYAHSWEDIRALLAELSRVRAERDEAAAQLEAWTNQDIQHQSALAEARTRLRKIEEAWAIGAPNFNTGMYEVPFEAANAINERAGGAGEGGGRE